MISQPTDTTTCPAGTPWCDNHDAEMNLCSHPTGSFVLTDTGGRRFSEGTEVAVATRRFATREPMVEVELPDTTDMTGIQWLTGPEARTLGLALTEAAVALTLNHRCPAWCTVDHQAVGSETRSADGAEVVIHEAEFGMVDLVQEQVVGRPLHESEMRIRLYVDQVSIADAHELIENANRAVQSAWGSR